MAAVSARCLRSFTRLSSTISVSFSSYRRTNYVVVRHQYFVRFLFLCNEADQLVLGAEFCDVTFHVLFLFCRKVLLQAPWMEHHKVRTLSRYNYRITRPIQSKSQWPTTWLAYLEIWGFWRRISILRHDLAGITSKSFEDLMVIWMIWLVLCI